MLSTVMLIAIALTVIADKAKPSIQTSNTLQGALNPRGRTGEAETGNALFIISRMPRRICHARIGRHNFLPAP